GRSTHPSPPIAPAARRGHPRDNSASPLAYRHRNNPCPAETATTQWTHVPPARRTRPTQTARHPTRLRAVPDAPRTMLSASSDPAPAETHRPTPSLSPCRLPIL